MIIYNKIDDPHFIDRSEFIKKCHEGARIIALTCPPKSGKTSILRLMNSFFDLNCDSFYLFENMSINSDKYFMKKNNLYPTIFIDSKKIDCSTRENFKKSFVKYITKVYNFYKYLDNPLWFNQEDLKMMERYRTGDFTIQEAFYAFKDLTRYLRRYHQTNVFLFVDDADHIFIRCREMATHNLEDARVVANYYKGMYGTLLKGNYNISQAVLLSSFEIPKDEEYDIICFSRDSDKWYIPYFGLSKDHLTKLFNQMQIDEINNFKKELFLCRYDVDIELYQFHNTMKYLKGDNDFTELLINDSYLESLIIKSKDNPLINDILMNKPIRIKQRQETFLDSLTNFDDCDLIEVLQAYGFIQANVRYRENDELYLVYNIKNQTMKDSLIALLERGQQ